MNAVVQTVKASYVASTKFKSRQTADSVVSAPFVCGLTPECAVVYNDERIKYTEHLLLKKSLVTLERANEHFQQMSF